MSQLNDRQRKEMARFQIHTKTGKEKFLAEIARAYETLAPARFRFFKAALARLNEINKNPDGGYMTKNGYVFVRYRIPKELQMMIQRWEPDFFKESENVDLLRRVWCDFAKVGKDRRKHTRLFLDSKNKSAADVRTPVQPKDATQPA
jgi:hypothetical protein